MSWVLATAGHVDHGKSTLVRAITGRDPDRLAEEKTRGLTIELGFAWTRLPGGGDIAFVDVPGHQRFVGTMLAGIGPAPAVVFVVAADQGWQAQSAEHLAAVQALGIRDGVLVISRCDLADARRRSEVAVDASRHLTTAGLEVPVVGVSAVTGSGMDELLGALAELTARLPAPDDEAPVRLWADRSFSIAGAGTVVTGTLGAGRVSTGDGLTLLDRGRARDVVVRGLHSRDQPRDSVGPVSRVAVNLRRVEVGEVSRSAVLLTRGAFALASVVDVEVSLVGRGTAEAWSRTRTSHVLPDTAVLHVGGADPAVRVRPLGEHHARLTTAHVLPWRTDDRAILRDPGSRLVWSVRVVDVDPLPLRRRGAGSRRAAELVEGRGAADLRLASRGADNRVLLARLGLPDPEEGVRVGDWWFHPPALAGWADRLRRGVHAHHRAHPLSAGMTVAEAQRVLHLPEHLRAAEEGGTLPTEVPAPGADLVRHLASAVGLAVSGGRVHDASTTGLGPAEGAVATVERRLRDAPFAAPDRDELAELGLGVVELAAAHRAGRLLRLADDVVLLPDGPARAMTVLAALEQPFTLSTARTSLDTTRRVAVPLLEHLDARGWTRRVDGQLRRVVR